MNDETQNLIWEWTGYNEVQSRTQTRQSPDSDQVEVAIRAIGICGTDLHIMSGHAEFGKPPLPLGHELAGVVVRIGNAVTRWRIGDRVCIDPLIGCGTCEACLSGNKHRCPDAGEIGLHFPGGWQQYMLVPQLNLYRLPDSVSFEEASQAETLHCCLGGIDKLEIRLGMDATVIGDGPTGLYYVQLLKTAGAGRVTLIGKRASRLELGRLLGADETVNLSPSFSNDIPAMESQDIVIDAAGTEASLQMGIELLKRGSQLLLFGLPGAPISVDIQTVVMKELKLLGTTNAPHVWPRVLKMMATGNVKVKPLITHHFRFEQLVEAVEFACNQSDEIIKIIVHNDPIEEAKP
ncbi:zinc-dependent alcohol dehydrogenase [Cohnella silvisoli]|uniref:Alcohol dehydrogenase catalytic domain-containing protein n=1 Tax=Cohnella silvisoli TaxID=2873699 RepID=A0ABV1L2G2_9BACL|nr:alcohol dehydrogenase catalytic domain-containing protein [Cohnella silvisoli]MCD9021552.1 alcohol dehydrogenase catalytic domain-containing protein [Cohnella silvisoli]